MPSQIWHSTTTPSRIVKFASDDHESILEIGLCRSCAKTHWLRKYSLSSGPEIDGKSSEVPTTLWLRVMSNNAVDDADVCEPNQIDTIVRFGSLSEVKKLFEEARSSWGESNECFLKTLRDSLTALSNTDGDNIQVKSF